MGRTFAELPGWSFEVREKSAGVYESVGTDAQGHRVQNTGTDTEAVLDECRDMAVRVVAELRGR
jgi:hypothetical protein